MIPILYNYIMIPINIPILNNIPWKYGLIIGIVCCIIALLLILFIDIEIIKYIIGTPIMVIGVFLCTFYGYKSCIENENLPKEEKLIRQEKLIQQEHGEHVQQNL